MPVRHRREQTIGDFIRGDGYRGGTEGSQRYSTPLSSVEEGGWRGCGAPKLPRGQLGIASPSVAGARPPWRGERRDRS
jgi:hypothetical protein